MSVLRRLRRWFRIYLRRLPQRNWAALSRTSKHAGTFLRDAETRSKTVVYSMDDYYNPDPSSAAHGGRLSASVGFEQHKITADAFCREMTHLWGMCGQQSLDKSDVGIMGTAGVGGMGRTETLMNQKDGHIAARRNRRA
jgi:hypothetical protein